MTEQQLNLAKALEKDIAELKRFLKADAAFTEGGAFRLADFTTYTDWSKGRWQLFSRPVNTTVERNYWTLSQGDLGFSPETSAKLMSVLRVAAEARLVNLERELAAL